MVDRFFLGKWSRWWALCVAGLMGLESCAHHDDVAVHTYPVRRAPQRGNAYDVTIESVLASGSRATFRAVVTVTDTRPHWTTLDVLVKHFTVPGMEPLWAGVHATVSVRDDTGWPWLTIEVSHPDAWYAEQLQMLADTFRVKFCVLPAKPHSASDRWTEDIGPQATDWKVGPVESLADGKWIKYHQHERGLSGILDQPATMRERTMWDVSQRILTHDGFVGECEVHDLLDTSPLSDQAGPPHPVNRISSIRVR